MARKVKIGQRVRDSISGFEGIVVAKTSYLYGCERVGVAPEYLDDDGETISWHWFDEPQVEVIGDGFMACVKETLASMGATGGPRADAKRKDNSG